MYTMHSPSQGYTSTSADVYGTRAYGAHLMAQNYSTYLNRDDPYNNGSSHYPNGVALQTAHYQTGSSSLSQHTYPTLPPISHFPHQQDVYASCVGPSRNLSYPTTPAPVSSSALTSSVPRNALTSKTYWNCDSVPQQNHCYSSNNPAINSTHKSSPQAWSHSPNVMSSPSSTPSPIPCPSTPHHFASSPHHSQSHSDSHKSYNGILNSSSLPSNGNSGANLNCNSNPLQSLQKMVQIESDSADIRVQYESSSVQSSVPIGSVTQHQTAQSNPQLGSLESETNYPTYYNLDQNRLCATPQSAYSSIQAQSINSAPFSSTLKSSQETRPQALQNNCTKQENGNESTDLNLARTSSIRYPSKLSKENNFLNSRSCSTDTCSNGSPSAQSSKVTSIPEPVIQPDQTHDSVNSFRSSETTANSRDSVKSTDSDAMSSYAANQCPTPNSTWKLNPAINQSNEFRQSNFANNSQSKSWWPENAISPSASRSFTPHISECAQYNSPNVNYPPSQVTHSMPQANSNSSIPSNQSWSQQASTPPSVGTTSQILSGAGFQPDGVVKKKRGRPFGSKNRRNIESSASVQVSNPPTDVTKRKRKTVLVDIGVNTSLSFDVQACLNFDDSYAFAESTVKHSLPLVMKRKKVVGPVVRIDKNNSLSAQAKYSIVNAAKFGDEDKDSKVKALQTKTCLDSLSQSRKNGLTKKYLNLGSVNTTFHDKNWVCVLCHKGPHYKGLGDLYGPYCICLDKSKLPSTLDSDHAQENHDDVDSIEHACERRSLRRRVDSTNEESKSKNTHPPTVIEDTKDCKANIEVWIHEDCIVWSNNVYLDGTKIRNLEPAIVESFSNICTKCKLPGATLGCIYKNCNVSPLHYLCAKDKDCDLDEEKFILSCSKHKKRRISPKDLDVVEVSEATTTATNET